MAGEEVEVNLEAEETLDPAPLAPTLVQRPDDGPTGPPAGSSSKPVQPPRTPDVGLSREQITPRFQVHLAAAENRVSNSLHQVVESLEKKIVGAVKQAAIDIIDNLGKQAAECILLSQRKAALLEYELNYSKENALSLLMQVKRVSDAQLSDAENKVLTERRRAQEAEVKLQNMQEINKKLKAELKRKGQQVEELQRSFYSATPQQGLQASVTEGPEIRKGGTRFKSSAGEKKIQQNADAGVEADALAMQPEVTIFDHSGNGITQVRTENASNRPLVHSVTYHDAYNPARVEKGVLASSVHSQDRVNVEVTATGHMTLNKLDNQQGSPTNQSASVVVVDKISTEGLRPHSSSGDSRPAVSQGEVLPSLMEKGQVTSSLKADLESRSAKDSDEEKSGLTIEALYCNDESLPPQVHPGDEYQSNKTYDHIGLDASDRAGGLGSGVKKYSHEDDISIHCTEELEIDEEDVEWASTFMSVNDDEKGAIGQALELSGGVTDGFQDGHETRAREKVGQDSKGTTEGGNTAVDDNSALKNAEASLSTGTPVLDAPAENAQVVNPVSTHSGNNPPNEDARIPEAQTESPDNLLSKRKRKQGATVSKYDLLVTEKSSKRLEVDSAVTGACDLLAAAGVDAHINSRDSRRLMQGARQLFSLAEGKWR